MVSYQTLNHVPGMLIIIKSLQHDRQLFRSFYVCFMTCFRKFMETGVVQILAKFFYCCSFKPKFINYTPHIVVYLPSIPDPYTLELKKRTAFSGWNLSQYAFRLCDLIFVSAFTSIGIIAL